MKLPRFAVAVAGTAMIATSAFAQPGAARVDPDASVRINQIQVIGTHNSYHAGLLPGIAKLLQQKNPDAFASLDYAHGDLATQLNHGIRQIELDIFADSKGGRFAHPLGAALVAQAGLPADPDPYPNGLMMKPGFKVMHVQDIDYASVCQPFTACLQIVRAWSRAHPEHVPIFILVETKQDIPSAEIPFTVPEPFTAATFDALDAEIRSVFSEDEMITPGSGARTSSHAQPGGARRRLAHPGAGTRQGDLSHGSGVGWSYLHGKAPRTARTHSLHQLDSRLSRCRVCRGK